VFEIGSSLREARVRQGLDFPEIERSTKIRAKYLKALEDEQFDVLPGETYVKGFLRTYAEYLGLDGQLYLDEFNSRYATGEEEPAPIGRPRVPGHRRVGMRPVLVALAIVAGLTVLVIAAWPSGSPKTELPKAPTTKAKKRHHTKPRQTTKKQKPARVARANLVLVATRGDSWIEAHAGSQAGKTLYEQTLQLGQATHFFGRPRLWLNVGQPSSLTWKLNGKARPSPGSAPGYFVVTAKGIVSVSATR
jgi:cytoskeletal protein RodZ